MKERLHKILALSTKLSRRAAEKVIAAGEVTVNGKTVTRMGTLADPDVDHIKWKGVTVKRPSEKLYLMYNKPKARMVTKNDELGRATIWSDLKGLKERVNAVGRLDYDSEGLIILTNDGELMNRLTHPKHNIRKIYNVKVKGEPTEEELNRLREGLVFEGISYQPAEVKIRYRAEKNTWLEVRISEGKYRQVRNMFQAINRPVLKLKRFAIGPIRLGKLATCGCRHLTKRDKERLLIAVGLMKPKPWNKDKDKRKGRPSRPSRPFVQRIR